MLSFVLLVQTSSQSVGLPMCCLIVIIPNYECFIKSTSCNAMSRSPCIAIHSIEFAKSTTRFGFLFDTHSSSCWAFIGASTAKNTWRHFLTNDLLWGSSSPRACFRSFFSNFLAFFSWAHAKSFSEPKLYVISTEIEVRFRREWTCRIHIAMTPLVPVHCLYSVKQKARKIDEKVAKVSLFEFILSENGICYTFFHR